MPDTAPEKPQQGRGGSGGPGLRDKKGQHVPMDVAAGDTVLFAKFGGTDVTLDGREYLILKEDDVLGVMPGKGAAGKAAPRTAAPTKAAHKASSRKPTPKKAAPKKAPAGRGGAGKGKRR